MILVAAIRVAVVALVLAVRLCIAVVSLCVRLVAALGLRWSVALAFTLLGVWWAAQHVPVTAALWLAGILWAAALLARGHAVRARAATVRRLVRLAERHTTKPASPGRQRPVVVQSRRSPSRLAWAVARPYRSQPVRRSP